MKFGMRKPSLKKSLKARTTTKYQRKVKKALLPGYGKKGMGWIKDPKKLLIIKCIRKQLSQFGICLNKIMCAITKLVGVK
ncbi:prophage protein [Lactococcus cremoris]|nr:prophage protein [Lactococcus cremoris]MDU8932047.1 hypothetical protein [Lactococcus cremoris]